MAGKWSAEQRAAQSRRLKRFHANNRAIAEDRAPAPASKPKRRKRRVVKHHATRTRRTRTESAPAIDAVTRRSMDYVRAAETAVLNNEIERLVGHVAQAIMLRGPMLQIQDYNLMSWCLRKMIENRAVTKGKPNGREAGAEIGGKWSPPLDMDAFATAYPAPSDPRD